MLDSRPQFTETQGACTTQSILRWNHYGMSISFEAPMWETKRGRAGTCPYFHSAGIYDPGQGHNVVYIKPQEEATRAFIHPSPEWRWEWGWNWSAIINTGLFHQTGTRFFFERNEQMLVATTLPGPDNLWHWLGSSVTGKRTIWLMTDVHFRGRSYKNKKAVIAASKNLQSSEQWITLSLASLWTEARHEPYLLITLYLLHYYDVLKNFFLKCDI